MSIKDAVHDKFKGTYDICIIGSGPVGLTLCAELVELAKAGQRICVLESGGRKKTPEADSLKNVENNGNVLIKQHSRERVFGGTSTAWSGLSAPLDEIDIGSRPYLSYASSWPISFSELSSYYERAGQYGFPDFRIYSDGLNTIKESGDLIIQPTSVVEKVFAGANPPWNFADKFQHIFNQPNIDIFLNATVTNIISKKDENGQATVIGVRVIGADKKTHTVSAGIFILAVGGIETSRLLLLSRHTCENGLGNEHDHVGRFIMNHPKNNFGMLRLKKPVRNLPYLFGYENRGVLIYTGFRVSEVLQRERRILNSYIRFEPVSPWTENNVVPAFVSLIKRRSKSLVSDIYRVIRHTPSLISYIMNKVFKKKPAITLVKLRNFMEMEPQAGNRITLSKIVDTNGNPVPKVTINVSDLDKKSLIELHKVFAEEMLSSGAGTVESSLEEAAPWPITADASHHLGGARMGLDPESSVVDSNLRVHSVNNLYICGGAVFPTSGCANPTYTMVALAIRLADTLKKR